MAAIQSWAVIVRLDLLFPYPKREQVYVVIQSRYKRNKGSNAASHSFLRPAFIQESWPGRLGRKVGAQNPEAIELILAEKNPGDESW